MDVVQFYTAGNQLASGDSAPTALTKLNAIWALEQAELAKRDEYLRGYYPTTGAPTLTIVGATVTCVDLDAILDGVRLAGNDTWDLTGETNGTYYLQVAADGDMIADTTENVDALTVGTVVMTGGTLSSLTRTITAINDNGGAGDMLKAVYDTDNDGVVDEAEVAQALAAEALTTAMIDPDAIGDGLLIVAGQIVPDVDGSTLVVGEDGHIAVPVGGITDDQLAADSVTVAKIDSADTPADGEFLAYIASTQRMEWRIPVGAGDMRRSIYDADNDGVVDAAEVASAVVALGVTGGMIAAGAVTETKLGDGAVTADKLALDAVTNTKIADGAVTSAKISGDLSGNLIEGNTLPYDALNAIDTPSDGHVYGYDSTANAGEWLDHGGIAGLGDDDHTQYHTDTRAGTWHSGLSGAHVTNGDSHDHVSGDGAALLAAALSATNSPSDNQLPSYDLATGKFTWVDPASGGGGGHTDEEIYDIIDGHLVAGTGITITPDDNANTLTVAVTADTYADAAHDHDSDYAAVDHDHDLVYAALAHDHDEDYAAANHNHDEDYAAIGHDHDEDYAAADHNHDLAYAAVGSGVTNGDSHNHDGGDGAQIDHGGLSGLSDDDHSQYHNDTRGDARYLRFVPLQLYADQLDVPTSADWAVNAIATTEADNDNAALTVAAFDDTTEEGRGFACEIPSGATNLVLKFLHRPKAAMGDVADIAYKLYYRKFADNAATPGSWNSHTLADITFPASENWQIDTITLALTAPSTDWVAGAEYQWEITRVAPADGTEVSGDIYLRKLTVGWS